MPPTYASFGTAASFMGLFRHDGVVNMPLSARRRRPYASSALKRRIYASFGTTASSICPFRHDRVVYMPLSARQRRLWASFGTTASSICPLSARPRRLYASFGTTASSICLFRHGSVVYGPLSARQGYNSSLACFSAHRQFGTHVPLGIPANTTSSRLVTTTSLLERYILFNINAHRVFPVYLPTYWQYFVYLPGKCDLVAINSSDLLTTRFLTYLLARANPRVICF